MDKQPVGQLPDLKQSNNDDEIMVITNSEYNQLKKEKISDLITDFTSADENNAIVKGTDGKLFTKDFGNASNITEGTLPVSVLPDIPKDKLPEIETDDLPDSGITTGTYTYPTDIVVNSKGQVTSITEGQAGANNANQDLSNLGPLGLDKINQSKALETGNVSSDADVYADIQKYAHSTFDKSKFEVVGSPIINDGILTASSLNYVTFTNVNLSTASSWKIEGKFTYKRDLSALQIVFTQLAKYGVQIYFSRSDIMAFQGSFNGSSWAFNKGTNKAFTDGETYRYIIEFTGTQYNLQISTDGVNYEVWASFDSSEKMSALDDTIVYAVGNSNITNRDFKGPIDLKSIAIWADGIPVFSGNITGTDTIEGIDIPYTLSKTGSKIVDAAYRDKVQDMYEQYGYAPYYTIDEENENFTLPMGEIYGMIERKNNELNKTQITNCILEAPNGVATYSGSTLTIKAGLKVLIPNGRNADGTLKNIEYTLENDSTKTVTTTYEHRSFVFIKNDGTCFTYGTESIAFYNKLADRPTPATNVFKCCFVDETNFWYVTSNGSPYEELKMAKIGIYFNNASSQITKLNTDEPINLLKQSDKSQVSGWGMPSGNYIDLTLGANDSQYTAPTNGWFVLTKRLGASAQLMTSVNSKFGFITYSNNMSNQLNQHTLPVKKGDTVTIHWSAAGSITADDGIRFIYAQGEEE